MFQKVGFISSLMSTKCHTVWERFIKSVKRDYEAVTCIQIVKNYFVYCGGVENVTPAKIEGPLYMDNE